MENSSNRQPLLLEKITYWLADQFKVYRLPIYTSFIVGILAYLFHFTNKLPNHDDVCSLFTKGSTTFLGRWGLDILSYIIPDYSMPWFQGVLTILLLTISICIIIRIFNIRSKLLQILLAGNIIAFPSLIGTFTYMFTSSSYAVSFLLSVLAVQLVQKKSKVHVILALLCLILSLSIYQSYIAVAASLLVLILIQQLLNEDNVIPVIQRGFFFVGFLVISLGLYYAITALIHRITGSGFSSYASNNLSFSIASVPRGIFNAYYYFYRIFREGTYGLIPTKLSRVIHLLAMLSVAALFFVWGVSQRRKNAARFLLIFALVAILPLAINCMFVFTGTGSIHALVLYGFVAIYILSIVVVETCLPLLANSKALETLQRHALNFTALALAFTIICNIYIANKSYLKLYLEYENTYAFYSTLIADMKMMPEFDENSRIALVGEYQRPYYNREQFGDVSRITGVSGFYPDIYSKQDFLKYYFGLSIPFVSDEEAAAIQASDAYAEMATYPYYGSMKWIDNILVVKLS